MPLTVIFQQSFNPLTVKRAVPFPLAGPCLGTTLLPSSTALYVFVAEGLASATAGTSPMASTVQMIR